MKDDFLLLNNSQKKYSGACLQGQENHIVVSTTHIAYNIVIIIITNNFNSHML